MDVSIISSVSSLTLTFIVIGFGYLSILLGYYLSRKESDFFSGALTPVDKMTLSFIIGSFNFLTLSVFFDLKIEAIDNFLQIVVYQSFLSIIIAFFISFMLDKKKHD